MVLEAGKITEEGLQRLRDRLGAFNRPRQYGVGLFNEFASRDAIRHFCQGIGDPNPLYQDESYARQTKYGTIIAPPCFLYSVYWCSGRTGGLPGSPCLPLWLRLGVVPPHTHGRPHLRQRSSSPTWRRCPAGSLERPSSSPPPATTITSAARSLPAPAVGTSGPNAPPPERTGSTTSSPTHTQGTKSMR